MTKVKLINKDTQRIMELESPVREQQLIENCLNYYHSGYDYKLLLLFHALAHSWNANELIYYINLIEEKNE